MTPLEAHQDYTTQVVKLMIWHVHELAHRDVEPISALRALDTNVDIMRKTTLFDGRHPALGLDPPVTLLKQALAEQIMSRDNTDELEFSCWQLLSPYLARWLEQAPIATYPFGCWNYNVDDNRPSHLNIHFLNAFQPESPFSDRHKDVISSLLRRAS